MTKKIPLPSPAPRPKPIEMQPSPFAEAVKTLNIAERFPEPKDGNDGRDPQ